MAGGAQERVARAGAPSFCERLFSSLDQPIAGARPRFIKSAVVALTDRTGNGLHFAEICTPVRNIAQRPRSERVVQSVFKKQSHSSLSYN